MIEPLLVFIAIIVFMSMYWIEKKQAFIIEELKRISDAIERLEDKIGD
ncbi:hypothetical protein PGH07_07715 [Sulfurovum sp. zt1-1]|uniref:Uncharacterized protein n=1 Tax=Sulfurovum zhangzhouensis TaxID=3019067 RepID=A0ABT7QZ12_9BACT|nr:hypothetical protein [Sulfurovum zhangzhouensis]MDM5272063.1 hypothetical protein [Sulfurovum zhangzhouensis]